MNKEIKIMVVRIPDYDGGYTHRVEEADYQLGDFEYNEFDGTLAQLEEQNPSFTNHVEPFHEEPQDWEITGKELVEKFLARLS